MLPNHYECTSCREAFTFARREALYHFNAGSAPLGSPLPDAELFRVPVRPGWCKACAALCLVEDLESVRAFEDAYSAARSGRTVEYPFDTAFLSPQQAQDAIAPYLQWRLGRRHAPRALCCGGTNYQLLDVAQPLIKHADCEFGVMQPVYFVSPYCGPGPGVRSPANIPVYDSEGMLKGLLTWFHGETEAWEVVPTAYPPTNED